MKAAKLEYLPKHLDRAALHRSDWLSRARHWARMVVEDTKDMMGRAESVWSPVSGLYVCSRLSIWRKEAWFCVVQSVWCETWRVWRGVLGISNLLFFLASLWRNKQLGMRRSVLIVQRRHFNVELKISGPLILHCFALRQTKWLFLHSEIKLSPLHLDCRIYLPEWKLQAYIYILCIDTKHLLQSFWTRYGLVPTSKGTHRIITTICIYKQF